MNAGLVAIRLRCSYGAHVVLDDVTFAAAPGEVVGILGPNGAGKSSTFGIVAGTVRPRGGTVHLDGRDLAGMPLHARARAGLGYLPQEPAFFPELDVAGNLGLALEAVAASVTPEALLARVDLAGFGPRDVRTLSGGERKRLAVARLLALDPRVVVLDEPFAGVDPVAVAGLQDLVRGLAADGRAVLLTDHAVRETLAVCTRVLLLDRGVVQAEGTPAEVLAHPHARARYFGDGVFLTPGVAGD